MTSTSPGTASRHRGPIVAAAVGAVVLLLIGAGVWWAVGRGDASATPDKSRTTDKSTSTSVCGLPDGSQQVQKEPPRGVVWTVPAYQAVPTKKSIGPGRAGDGIHSCFAHNPDGALFAAVYFSADLDDPDVDQPSVYRTRAAQNAEGRRLAKEAETSPAPSSEGAAQLAGYRINSYDRRQASLDLVYGVTEGPKKGGLFMIPALLRWTTGDWQTVITEQQKQVQVTSLEGFTEWGSS